MLRQLQMPYPGYLLNPGDMFQVEVDRVLYATGAPKTTEQIRSGRKLHRAQRRAGKMGAAPKKKSVAAASVNATAASGPQANSRTQMDIKEVRKQRRLDLKELLTQAEGAMADKKRRVGAKRKIAIRSLVRDIRKAMSTINRKTPKELEEQLASLVSQLAIAREGPAETSAADEAESSPTETSDAEQQALREAITRARENPIDDSKPYATPWRPRPYMSAFAFIPRYLEVNHNICSAVYIRHPVVRWNQSEVPSPFGHITQQLAFNWYLRRGR